MYLSLVIISLSKIWIFPIYACGKSENFLPFHLDMPLNIRMFPRVNFLLHVGNVPGPRKKSNFRGIFRYQAGNSSLKLESVQISSEFSDIFQFRLRDFFFFEGCWLLEISWHIQIAWCERLEEGRILDWRSQAWELHGEVQWTVQPMQDLCPQDFIRKITFFADRFPLHQALHFCQVVFY